jgi:hypothetical protein
VREFFQDRIQIIKVNNLMVFLEKSKEANRKVMRNKAETVD